LILADKTKRYNWQLLVLLTKIRVDKALKHAVLLP
jgi:hypothetical protein